MNFTGRTKKHVSTGKTNEQNKKRILNQSSSFDVVESYKDIRTNIVFSLPKQGCKVIAVSSSIQGEGKSTTCFNLALTFAEIGSKVLVVDCDLRRPNIANLLGIDKGVGLSNVLVNDKKIDQIINRNVYHGVDVISSGVIPPNPAELLASDAMKNLLDELKNDYDYIFFDTPPITIVTDTLLLTKITDGIIIVVRQDVVDKRAVAETVSKIKFANAKILGFILNDVKYSKTGYRYGEYYKYGYTESKEK